MQGPIRILACRGIELFTRAVCGHLALDLSGMKVVRFANDQLMPIVRENVREADVFILAPTATSTNGVDVNASIVELCLAIDALKRASAGRITVVVPYFPYARSDKKDQPRIPIGARLMANLLERAGANRVLTMDLHSAQIQGFCDIPVDHLEARPILVQHYRGQDLGNAIVVASDVGEAKEAGGFARQLNLPLAIVDKRRSGNEDKAKPAHIVGDVDGKDAILIDDEISTAGTLVEASTFLLEHGAKSVRAGATHAIFAGPAVDRLKSSSLTEVVVTDTVPLPDHKRFDKLVVLSVAELFARAIRCIHDGDSVSVLFNGK